MVLLTDAPARRSVLLFGEGLIGSSIISFLVRHSSTERFDFSYADFSAQTAQLARITNRLDAWRIDRLAVIWAAGKAGFSASEDEAKQELAVFRRLLSFCEENGSRRECSFHCVSSAGALFEGQNDVNSRCIPNPLRPYARLKLEEEQLLAGSALNRKHVYRLSSAYGHIHPLHRRGLIPTLIFNGLTGRTSRIFGNLDTLRDYLWVKDAAVHIAGSVESETTDSPHTSMAHLVSGKSTSIAEVMRIVEEVIQRKLSIVLDDSGENCSSISFSPSILPDSWQTTDIGTAARLICESWRRIHPAGKTTRSAAMKSTPSTTGNIS